MISGRLVDDSPPLPFIKEIKTLRIKTPPMSSATAAPRTVAPSLLSIWLNSRKTATEIETEVAEKITPIKSDSNHWRPNNCEARPMTTIGRAIPPTATAIAGLRYFFSSDRSLSNPAINIRTITPISWNSSIIAVW